MRARRITTEIPKMNCATKLESRQHDEKLIWHSGMRTSMSYRQDFCFTAWLAGGAKIDQMELAEAGVSDAA